ncbi:hypothetical protein Q8G50_32925, partial [Klebsiella pneumoniae]
MLAPSLNGDSPELTDTARPWHSRVLGAQFRTRDLSRLPCGKATWSREFRTLRSPQGGASGGARRAAPQG